MAVEERTVQGRGGPISVRDHLPHGTPFRTRFLWVHGGGSTSGGLDQRESDGPARALAARDVLVRTIDHRLAPRAVPWREPVTGAQAGRFPAGLDDVVDVATAFAAERGTASSLGGASAGADLAAAAVTRLRDGGEALPRALVLADGTLHATPPPDDGVEADLRGALAPWACDPTMLRRTDLDHGGGADLIVPGYAFPGGAELSRFPPALVLDAEDDRLRRSGHAFAGELQAAGSTVREVVLAAGHGFLGSTRSRAFADGLQEIVARLARHD